MNDRSRKSVLLHEVHFDTKRPSAHYLVGDPPLAHVGMSRPHDDQGDVTAGGNPLFGVPPEPFVAGQFDGRGRPSAQARRWVYDKLEALLDTLEEREDYENLSEPSKRRVHRAIAKVRLELNKKAHPR